jgi:hypothetical protein
MKLYEVDQGSVRDVLAVLQGLADKDQQPSELPFPTVMNILKPFGLGISTPDGLIALKNEIDPNGDTFDISDDGKGTVILNTKNKKPNQGTAVKKATGPSVEKMASANSKNLKPNI